VVGEHHRSACRTRRILFATTFFVKYGPFVLPTELHLLAMILPTTVLLLSRALLACRIDNALHGVFKRQLQSNRNLIFDSSFKDPIIYDEITISATSISDFGECYEKAGLSYVFGLKRMGRPICHRCVTPILKSENILQLAHQQGEICYETVGEAKSSCFDAARVGHNDGTTVFRADAVPASCYIDGRFSLQYDLLGADLTCNVDSGSEVHNCELSGNIAVRFRNCSFPDFDMSLKCIGSFVGSVAERYIIVLNEESEEYRCGLLMPSTTQDIFVYFSKDSSCALLTENSAFEKYSLTQVNSEHIASPCQFPSWIRGQYDSLTVTADWLQYDQLAEVAVTSRCVHVNENRVLVYSETKCGEPLGYHCLWFSPRSESLIEFKTTTPRENANSTLCSTDGEFSQWSWTAAVINNPIPSSCGILGTYATPADLRTLDCFNVSIDCDDSTKMKITASHCSTDVIFDSRQYQCIASWKDENSLYIYTTRDQQKHSCFVAQYSSNRLYLSSTGPHCIRDFNFSENSEKTIVLQEETGCLQMSKSSKKPANSTLRSSPVMQVDSALGSGPAGQLLPVGRSSLAKSRAEWTSEENIASNRVILISPVVLVCHMFL
ncbi:hypothetical protein Angca_001612, partial [Angiostrongylus cantonensis]